MSRKRQLRNMARLKPLLMKGERAKKILHFIKRKSLKGEWCNLGCCSPGSPPSPIPFTK